MSAEAVSAVADCKINADRGLDLYQKAIARVVDGPTAALIEREFQRLRRLADTGA